MSAEELVEELELEEEDLEDFSCEVHSDDEETQEAVETEVIL